MLLKNVITVAVILGLFPITVIAQTEIRLSDKYEVELGKPYPVLNGRKYYFESNGSVICFKDEGGRWFVQRLSADGLIQTSVKRYEDIPNDLVVEHVGYFGRRLFVFYSIWDKETEHEQLFYREMDTENGAFLGAGTRMLTVVGKVQEGGDYGHLQTTNKFDFAFSANGEYSMVLWTKKRDKKDDSKENRLSAAVFNNALEEQWKVDIKTAYAGEDMQIEDYMIDDQGDICIIARSDSLRRYEFLRCTQQGVSWRTTSLDQLWDHVVLSLLLFRTKDGELRAAGFDSAGFFMCSFNDMDQATNLTSHEVHEEERVEGAWWENLGLDQVIMKEDGGMLLVGEQRYTTVEYGGDGRGHNYTYTRWHADDLLVCNLSAGGDVLWTKRLPKQETSRTPIGVTYRLIHGGGAYSVVHFDFASGLAPERIAVRRSKAKMLVVADRIEENTGALTREVILDPTEVKGMELYQLSMNRVTRTKADELLIEAYKKQKQDILVRIKAK